MDSEKKLEAIKETINEFNILKIDGNEAVMKIYDILDMNNMEELLKKAGFYKRLGLMEEVSNGKS